MKQNLTDQGYIDFNRIRPEPVPRQNISTDIANIPMLIILTLLLLNTLLYFALKVFIVSHPRAHYINTTNDQFREMSFYSFFNMRGIIYYIVYHIHALIEHR